jgi:hypothetical protein
VIGWVHEHSYSYEHIFLIRSLCSAIFPMLQSPHWMRDYCKESITSKRSFMDSQRSNVFTLIWLVSDTVA